MNIVPLVKAERANPIREVQPVIALYGRKA